MAPSVLHVVPALAARYGGPSAATVGMCRALRAEGWTTLIATTDADGAGRLPVPLATRVDHEGVPCIFFPRRASEAFKWSPDLTGWLKSHVGEFDVVHIHAVFSHSSIAAGRACRLNHVPYIVRPLGTLDPWSLKRRSLAKRVLTMVGAGPMLTGAARIHYTSRDEQRLAESAMGPLPPGRVVPLGLDESFWVRRDATPRVPRPEIVVLSRLDEKKGIDVLIEAFHLAAGRGGLGEAWSLTIAGTGRESYVAHLHALASRGPAAQRIRFAGWVAGQSKVDLLRRASLFVLPSHQENFGIAVAEAMASGVPVIVSPHVNLADDIAAAGAGWIVPRESPALAAAIEAACADEAERGRRGEAAEQLGQRYKWASLAADLTAMYDEIRSGSGAVRPVRRVS